jgi:small ligand-binding sensory domain FIST
MKLFAHAHASHPDWRMALSLAAVQIEAQRHDPSGRHIQDPTLGWVYFSDAFAPHVDALLAELKHRWPGVDWVGAAGLGVAANGVEYLDEPALALMLSDLPREHFRVFSGLQPLGPRDHFRAGAAQVHSDPSADDLPELVAELSARTRSGYLFGGVASGRGDTMHIANGVFRGGLSGVAFGSGVKLVSRVTQGCQPVGPARRITQSLRNVVGLLDGKPALDGLLADLGIGEFALRQSLSRLRDTLVGLSDGGDDLLSHPGQFGTGTLVRNLIGIDLQNRALAVAGNVEDGMQLAFCRRDAQAARLDLVRICTAIR